MAYHEKTTTALLFGLAIFAIGCFWYLGPQLSPPPVSPVVSSESDGTTTASTTNPTGTTSPEIASSTELNGLTTPTTPLPSVSDRTTDSRVTSASVLSNMHLTFADEFTSFSRYTDSKGNITCEPGGVGTWQTVYHFCSRTIPSNFEAEIYIDQNFLDYLAQSTGNTTAATSPFTISNSILNIEAKPADAVITKAAGAWAKYTSGLITTQFSFAQQYGYFEMRAQMPAGSGLWPAFWLLPVDKSWPPEIDVMEAFGGKNSNHEGGVTSIHYASHTVKKGGLCGDWHDVGVDITKGFHTYGVNWQPDTITYFFDGVAYATCPGNGDANQPFYLLVNLAVGSSASWPGSPSAATPWPAVMQVDYVRAYQTN